MPSNPLPPLEPKPEPPPPPPPPFFTGPCRRWDPKANASTAWHCEPPVVELTDDADAASVHRLVQAQAVSHQLPPAHVVWLTERCMYNLALLRLALKLRAFGAVALCGLGGFALHHYTSPLRPVWSAALALACCPLYLATHFTRQWLLRMVRSMLVFAKTGDMVAWKKQL